MEKTAIYSAEGKNAVGKVKKIPIQFDVKPFGCGFCDEVFEIEKEFLDHCSDHAFSESACIYAVDHNVV